MVTWVKLEQKRGTRHKTTAKETIIGATPEEKSKTYVNHRIH